MMNILFVLRGRPGLGHVIPGLALAQQALGRGHQALILTYSNGAAFLSQSTDIETRSISVPQEYSDWPGLNIYDHGLRLIAPIADDFDADFIFLGGEYLLAPLQDIVHRPCVMLFNPEIMEKNDRNLMPTRLFLALFKHCQFLAPIQPLHPDDYFDDFLAENDRMLPAGPYVPLAHCEQKIDANTGRRILIANGGGISFPSSTRSYSSDSADPRLWIEETRKMTYQAVNTALNCLDGGGKITLYSCLGEKWNKQLRLEFADEQNLEICPPSIAFYTSLAEADLVISRAGVGFIADVQSTAADVILWCLTNHDEQRSNALRLSTARPATFVANDLQQLEAFIIDAFAKGFPGTGQQTTASETKQNNALVIQYLEETMSA